MKLYLLIQVWFVVLLNFRTVFFPVPLFSTTHAGVCTFGHSGESEGIVERIVERVVWIAFKFCFCRDWWRISILKTGIPKVRTGCFRNRGWGWLCKTGGCFYFPFSDCPLFCLSNFLCVIRITCHGVCSYSCTIDHPTGDRLANLVSFFSLASLQSMLNWQTDLQYYLSIFVVGILVWQKKFLCWNQTGLY